MTIIQDYLDKNNITRYKISKLSGIGQPTLKAAVDSKSGINGLTGKVLKAIALALDKKPGAVLDELIEFNNQELNLSDLQINEKPFYNLLVSADASSWENDQTRFDRSRFLESTNIPEYNGRNYDSHEKYLEQLIDYPCLFLYEKQVIDEDNLPYAGYIGKISNFKINGNAIEINYKTFNPITLDDVQLIQQELEIKQTGFTELNRTHWAVKNVNLIKAINDNKNLSLKLQPTVFISYSQELASTKKRVESLVKYLKDNGVDVTSDLDSLAPGMDLNYFMESVVRENNKFSKIFVICDHSYAKKADRNLGGVGKEAEMMKNLIANNPNQIQVVPIFFENIELSKIPIFLQGKLGFNYPVDNENEVNNLILKNIFNNYAFSPK
ncbi:TIR domain-containing protein [Latilactobacillus curvatus]|uniref:TIR domain-containing protein n=1 Tax=Latilactobacillus curvatus TaxID=28038 RepID=UPI002410BA96|nr:TIR domain-containing protein [Latilactobacillus curvatus]MDG2984368.1 toll/interleukin-1 receptor domain-containing protein [Latilactobacillus curvatus]